MIRAVAAREYVNVGAPEIQSTVAEFLNPNFTESKTAAKNVGGKLVGPGSSKKPRCPRSRRSA